MKRRMSVDLKDTSVKRQRKIMELKDQVSKKITYRRPLLEEFNQVAEGTPEDFLRKEILKQILLELLNNYGPKMKTVPCKEHLIEKGIQIERNLFRKASIDTYTDLNVLKKITTRVIRQVSG